MATTLNHDNSITVVGYSLPEFCFELTELGAKGYTVTYENSHVPFGGMGSIYQCTVVPRHGYYIDKEGNHINAPKDNVEVAVESVEQVSTASVTPKPVVQTTKTTRTKKTTT